MRAADSTAWALAALGGSLGEGCALQADEVRVETVRERSWGSIRTLEAGGRRFWLKVPHPGLAREVPLRRLLSARAPEAMLPVLADHSELGWMVTADQGPVLAARAREQGHHWYPELARALARVQRSVTPGDVTALAEMGVPVFAPQDAHARLDEQLAPFAALEQGHPARCAAGERARALEAMDAVVEQWQALAATAPAGLVPGLSVDHNDLHGGNAFVDAAGVVRLTDWGDAVLAHPFCSLRALLVPVRHAFGADAAREVREAYLREWSEVPQELEVLGRALDLAVQLAVAQRLSCWTVLADAGAWAEYAEYIVPLWREIGVGVDEVSEA